MRKTVLKSMVLALALSGAAWAGDVQVKDAWVRATVTGQMATGVFMEITSKEGAKLTGAASPAAGVVEVHTMKMVGGVMKMRQIPALELPAGKAVTLGPGGYHIMLMDIKQPLKKGESMPVTLVIEGKDGKTESVEVKAEVRDLTTAGGMGHMKH